MAVWFLAVSCAFLVLGEFAGVPVAGSTEPPGMESGWAEVRQRQRGTSPLPEGSDPRLPAVRLLVVNRAGLRPEMLKAAEQDATSIYRAAGIEVSWVNATGGEASYDYAVDFMVMIVSGKEAQTMAARLEHDTMGYAVRGSDNADRGGMAFVLFDRVEDNATKHHVSISTLLGKVIAHEVGHLLLPSHSHSERGIMRAVWDLRSGLLEYFTSTQAEAMRQWLTLAAGSLASRNKK